MATAKKLPSGSWRCLVYDYTDQNGKRHYKSFTSDNPSPAGRREAEAAAAAYAFNKKEIKNSGTFSSALETYIQQKENVLSPSTIRGYKIIQTVLKEEFEWFCNMEIDRISHDDIQQLIGSDSQKRSPKTVRNHHGLISAVLKSSRPDFAPGTSLPQKVRPNLNIPTDENIQALMEAVEDTELEIPVMLAAFGTMRRGEICGLSIDDLEGNIMHVHHSLVMDSDGKLQLKAPKTYSSDRYVDLPEFVAQKIREKGYITKLKPHSITIMFQRVLEKNEIPHFRFHDLRHYSASIQHALGIPDAYIMQRGGWSSDAVLKSVYRHAMDDHQKEMNGIANDHFEKLMQHEMQHKK